MNTTTTPRNRIQYPDASLASPRVRDVGENCYSEIDQQQQTIEHRTISGFMRMISPKWHIDDINRFGKKVGDSANALQMAYVTSFDTSLGLVRTFPMPFLMRIYQVMQPQFKWPEIIEIAAPALEDRKRDLEAKLKGHRRTEEHLRLSLDVATDAHVRRSMTNVLQWLEREIAKLEVELALDKDTPGADEGEAVTNQ